MAYVWFVRILQNDEYQIYSQIFETQPFVNTGLHYMGLLPRRVMLQTIDVPIDISNMKDRGLPHSQKPRRELKTRRVEESVFLTNFEVS